MSKHRDCFEPAHIRIAKHDKAQEERASLSKIMFHFYRVNLKGALSFKFLFAYIQTDYILCEKILRLSETVNPSI